MAYLPVRPIHMVGVLALLTLCACGRQTNLAPVSELGRQVEPRPNTAHRVVRGDTLGSIAFRYGLSYRRLASWNRIPPPYTIYPGQRLRLTPPPTDRSARSDAASKRRGSDAKPMRKGPTVTRPASGLRWQWPTRGPILRRFDRDGVGKKGIDIGGRPGQPILAAANGKIVYAGSGLKGYGRLIIIKHDKNYLSAYAHNRSLTAKEGERVSQGQRIAEMGDTGAKRTMLHFEIRFNGKAVDPLRYLPPRPP